MSSPQLPSTATIEPINLNGLVGRTMLLPAQKQPKHKTTILLIYGIHSSHERMAATAEFLSQYGQVVAPDLPGIGGMTSFYTIGKAPTLDMYGDYLYTYLKASKRTQRVKVVAMSFGFLVVTRMLQRHPDAQAWIDDVISFVGFGQASDFKRLQAQKRKTAILGKPFTTKLGAWLVSVVIFNPLSLRIMFGIFRLFNPKYRDVANQDRQAATAMELDLWQKNDARTRFSIYELFFSFNLTTEPVITGVPLHDMTTPHDQYFSAQRVTKSLHAIYQDVTSSKANLELHAPSILGSPADLEVIFSDQAKTILGR
jgi:pimeloyl-ACP methyl ester carboxylesterase